MRNLGFVCLALAAMGTIIQLCVNSAHLPPSVASNFGVGGMANNWMPRASFLGLHVGTQLVTAGTLVGVARYSRYLPASLLNMPHKEYWLAETRREATLDYTEAMLTLIAGVTAIFLTGTFQLVYQANIDGTQRLALGWFVPLLIGYVVLVIMLVVVVFRRFGPPPTDDRGAAE